MMWAFAGDRELAVSVILFYLGGSACESWLSEFGNFSSENYHRSLVMPLVNVSHSQQLYLNRHRDHIVGAV